MASVGENLKGNILGITEKAIIEVIDLRDRKPQEEGPVPARGVDPADRGQLDDGKITMANAGWMEENMKATGKPPSIAGDFRGSKAKYFRVQFNPNTLRLTGHSGGLVKSSTFKKKQQGQPGTGDQQQQGSGGEEDDNGGLEYKEGKTYIELSVSLFFDKVDPQDAFLEDKLALASPTNIGKGIAKGVMTAKGKKNNTVQPEVEGFIGALRNKHTRLITFHWGDFNYTGILRNVTATYTMFNITGRPIRAVVDLTLTCADSEIAQKSVATWNHIYYNAFDKGSESFVTVSQKAGNFVNI